MGSGRSTEDMKKLIGVVIFNFSLGGLTGLKWASDYMKLPTNHELCIILVKLDEKVEKPFIGERLVRDDMEEKFRDEMEGHQVKWKERFDVVQAYVQKIVENKYGDNVQGRICTGRTVQDTLQLAIGELHGLHTLVLGWTTGADAGSQMTTPETDLTKLSGIKNIILAEIDPKERDEKTPSFSALVVPEPPPPPPPAVAPPPPPPTQQQDGTNNPGPGNPTST